MYLYYITDPVNNKRVVKYGRTQHLDSKRRYVGKERKLYKMKLIKEWRGKLKNTTIAENWWKSKATTNNLFYQFSNSKFHGATECIDIDDDKLQEMIKKTEKIINKP